MTRVNHCIPPEDICDQMLVAERKEFLDVLRHAQGRSRAKNPGRIPDRFTLNRGHALYFVDKGCYITSRCFHVDEELRHRGITLQTPVYFRLLTDWPKELWNADWIEPEPIRCRDLLRERILQQLDQMVRIPRWTRSARPGWAR